MPGTTCKISNEGIWVNGAGFFSSSSAFYLLSKCERLWVGPWCNSSWQLFPASCRGCSWRETCGRAGWGLHPTRPSFRQGPSVTWWEESQRQVRLLSWLSPFHPRDPVLGRVTPAEEVGKRQARARRPLQWAAGELRGWTIHAPPGRTACVSHYQVLIRGELPTLSCWEEWRRQWQILGIRWDGPQLWQQKAMWNQKSGFLFHGTSGLWNKTVQGMGKKKKKRGKKPHTLTNRWSNWKDCAHFHDTSVAETNENPRCSSKKHHNSGSH